MLVLGTKYGVDELRQEAISRLMSTFAPRSLDEWDALMPNSLSATLPAQWEDCLLDVTNVARTHELDRLHLFCLYHCCQLGAKEIVAGKPRADGREDCLPVEDIVSCIEGRAALTAANLRLLQSLQLAVGKTQCTSSTTCRAKTDNFLTRWRNLLIGPPARPRSMIHNPLGVTPSMLAFLIRPMQCRVCTDAMKDTLREHREQIWKDLHLHLSQPEPRPLPVEN